MSVTDHITDGSGCWCDPLEWMLCDECEGDAGGCWKCRRYSRPAADNASGHPTTAGLVPHDGSDLPGLIIHRGPPE